jgi:hypothetical protein
MHEIVLVFIVVQSLNIEQALVCWVGCSEDFGGF